MLEKTLPQASVQRYYDRLGKNYDWFEVFEGRAKQRARALLDLTPGMRLLNVGAGTGREHSRLARLIGPNGSACAIDYSWRMARLAHDRSASPVCHADACKLPFTPDSFDRLYTAYVLDLLSLSDIALALDEFLRVLIPGGKLVFIALTEGIDSPSRALTALWKAAFKASPLACGGCRPLQLSGMVARAGFILECREVIVQLALPSELIRAQKPVSTEPT